MDYNINCSSDFEGKYLQKTINLQEAQTPPLFFTFCEQSRPTQQPSHLRISVTHPPNSLAHAPQAVLIAWEAHSERLDCWEQQKSYSFQKCADDGELDGENTASAHSLTKNASPFGAGCDKQGALLLVECTEPEESKPQPKGRTHRNSHKLQLNAKQKQQKIKLVQNLLQQYKLEGIDQPIFIKQSGRKIAKTLYRIFRRNHSKSESMGLALEKMSKINNLHQFKKAIQEDRLKQGLISTSQQNL